MDGPPNRWVIVDDTSPEINYIGASWFSDVKNWDSVGSSGMPYLSTQHATRSIASFKFDFTGSAVAVLGANLGSKSTYWTCSVDGVALESTASSPICTSPCNNSLFCNATALDDGHHTLTVEASPTGNQTFWFDRIEYVASQQVSREGKAIRITSSDPYLIGTLGKEFTFYGVSVSWYGSIHALINASQFNPPSWSMDQGDANYTWDWRASTLSNPDYPLQNQKFFETPTYPMGVHTLRVTDTVGFKYVIVQNGTVLPSTTNQISNPSTTGTMVAKPGIPGRVIGGIIAGGVVGGILVFGIVVLVTYFCRWRMKSQSRMDKPFFNQKLGYTPDSPILPKSLLLPGHLPFVAYTPNPPPSIQTTRLNEPQNSTSNWTPTPTPTSTSGSDGFNANHFGDQGQPPPQMPRITQRAPTTVVHLPPEYTPT